MVNDEKYFGITVHFVNKKIDTGDIIIKKKFPIKDKDNFKTILKIASINCSKLLITAIKLVLDKKNYSYKIIILGNLQGSKIGSVKESGKEGQSLHNIDDSLKYFSKL